MPPRFLTAILRAALARVNNEFSLALTRIPRATKFYDPLAFSPVILSPPARLHGAVSGTYNLRRRVMNDNTDFFKNFLENYAEYKNQLQEANQKNKVIVFDALQAANITSVQVEFDGVG